MPALFKREIDLVSIDDPEMEGLSSFGLLFLKCCILTLLK